MSEPFESTGWAAPMLVVGAIAATCPAIVMNVPADAARAPGGATKVTIGTRAFRKRPVILYVESMRPPGVSITNTIAAACLDSPSSTMRST